MKLAVFETQAQKEAYNTMFSALIDVTEAFNLSDDGSDEMTENVMKAVKEAIDTYQLEEA